MSKDSLITPRRTIILLVFAGLIYLIWPRISYSGVPWLEPSASLPVTAALATDASPAPAELVTMTTTPAPENLTLVAAQLTTMTATVTTVSTSSPTPQFDQVPVVVTPRPTPTNQATADYLDALATAEARINGAASPPDSRTANPNILTATRSRLASPTSISFLLVTETPTPQNIITVAAEAARATAVATAIGTYTPMPSNWIVPIVITPEPATPVPANAATAAFQVAEATAAAFVNGTPTPIPFNVWTATPTPFMLLVAGEVATPWVPEDPTPTPMPIPQELVGKILFLSNRSGGPQPLAEPLVYAIDPDGSNLAVMNDDTLYNSAVARNAFSADQRYRTFAQEVSRYYGLQNQHELALAIFFYDDHFKVDQQITYFGTGEAWEPAWSPVRDQIAFVSDVSGPAEIWIINRDGSGQQKLTQTDEALLASRSGKDNYIPDDAHGHPSFSPDGSKLVYWSSRSGHRQVWVMNIDGTNAYSLSTTNHDDWDPVWINFTDPAREAKFGIKFPVLPSPTPNPERDGDKDKKRVLPTTEPPSEDEPPTDEPPTDEPPTDEPPTDEPPTDEPPTDEPPTDEPPTDEPPTDEPPADEPPADEPPADEPPTDEPPDEQP